jgi:translation initiation factor 1
MADICKSCGLPSELCVCEEIAREQQDITIWMTKRRYGKTVTIIEGLDADIDIENLAKILKTKCASGGTVKDGNIELQGDHKKKVAKSLEELGYKVKVK